MCKGNGLIESLSSNLALSDGKDFKFFPFKFFREVLFSLKKGGKFVLLYDERNPAFFRKSTDGEIESGLWPLLSRSIPEGRKPDVRCISIQSVVQTIEDSKRHGSWVGEFKTKYGLF